jgi:hypothetical protein
MPNSIKTDSLFGHERIAEISEILAQGLSRITARQSREISLSSGEFPLDISGVQSGDPTPRDWRKSDG